MSEDKYPLPTLSELSPRPTEYLTAYGIGGTRDDALEHADKQAAAYFGQSEGLIREIGKAEAMSVNYSGEVAAWSVRVEYRMER